MIARPLQVCFDCGRDIETATAVEGDTTISVILRDLLKVLVVAGMVAQIDAVIE